MLQASECTGANSLASQYITAIYYGPPSKDTPTVNLEGLLGKARIFWIQNDFKKEYSLEELTNTWNKLFKNAKKIDVISTWAIASDEKEGKITAILKIIEYRNRDDSELTDIYGVTLNLSFTTQKDETKSDLFICKLVHKYEEKILQD